MTTAFLSDIHGNLSALEAVWNYLEAQDVSEVYNLGDTLNGPLWPEETAEFLISKPIVSILGNGDEDILLGKNKALAGKLTRQTIDYLASLPKIFTNEVFTLFHASPTNVREYLLEKIVSKTVVMKSDEEISLALVGLNTQYVICGHSHVERIVQIDDQIVINAGSVGLPAYEDDDPYHCMETYNPMAKFVMIKDGNISVKYVSYDYRLAADQARKNGRHDWARWITHGLCE